jgi:hypothetical protein
MADTGNYPLTSWWSSKRLIHESLILLLHKTSEVGTTFNFFLSWVVKAGSVRQSIFKIELNFLKQSSPKLLLWQGILSVLNYHYDEVSYLVVFKCATPSNNILKPEMKLLQYIISFWCFMTINSILFNWLDIRWNENHLLQC